MTRANFILGAAVILSIAATPGLFAGPANAQKRDVSMRLDWLYQGPNSGFMVAKDKGFYDEAGLNVDMGPGRGSGSTSQLVASKAAMIGFADGFVVGAGIAKGMDIVMVAAIYRRNPTAVITLKEAGFKSVKELEGKTIGIPPGGTQFQQWPAFVKGCKLDGSKITVASVDPAGAVPALVTGKVQAIASYAQGAVPGVEIRSKKEADIFWYADCGVTAVSNGIIVHKDLLKSDPELVRAFVKASLRGFLYARQHPDEAVEITRKFSQAVVPEIARRELEMSWNTWVTPNTAGKPLGWMSDKDWDDTVESLKQYGGVTTPLKAADLYTNDLVPTASEFVPPQPK
jgi:NitT/TauT family transport system substrate-binding protein